MTKLTDIKKYFSRACVFKYLFIISLTSLSFSSFTQVTANFSSDSTQGCNLLELSLINLSTGATSYLWELYDESGDLISSSTLTNPSFFLTSPGSYSVQLTAYDLSGDSDVLTLEDFAFVYTNPAASFINSDLEGCAPIPITFIQTATPGTYGSIDEYYWVITGAPTLPATPTINYTFTAPGTYTVYLFVTDGAGCSDYTTKNVTIYDTVNASFISDAAISCTLPFTVNFINLSSGTGSLYYEWDFGDGTTSTSLDPSHTYTTYGDYDVTLITTNSDGCTDTIFLEDYIQVNPTAPVDFAVSPDTICVGESVNFNNLSGLAVGTWLWDFGDGSTSTAFETNHTYTAAGVYDVSLFGDFGGGCEGMVNYDNLITVLATPTVSFTSTDPTAVCELPYTVTFTPDVTGGPVTLLWAFEEPAGTDYSEAVTPTNLWNALGSYDVTLTATNAAGCATSYTANDYVTIGELEVTPAASPESGCIPLGVNFDAIAGEALTTYEWDFGDGSTPSTLPSPNHVYNSIGCYIVTLIATSVSGCIDTTMISDLVCAGDTGTAQLIVPDTTCPGALLEVLFLPLDSISADIDGGVSYVTVTGVDSFTTINLPSGDHNIDFITWSYGCPDTLNAQVYVLEVIDSNLVVEYTCDNPYQMQIFIDAAMADASCGWEWDFGDGTIDSINANPVHVYAAPGMYHVSITYDCITPDPCTGTGVDVFIQVPSAGFINDPIFGCDTPTVINFTDTSTDYNNDILTYAWDFGDGGTSFDQNPSHSYTGFGAYYVNLEITDDRGCVDE
ncbi:MAG: PKD domain-containing protein, partial [Chitinophagales bacterium]|nr:PKD domain-containing protein [Chitinophagales bacterium]